MATKVIYFTIGDQEEQAEFRSDDSVEEVRDIFRAAAEAGRHDILKLYKTNDNGRCIINISPKLPENTPDTRYNLVVVAALPNGSPITSQLGFDISETDRRIQELEKKILVESGETPDVVHKMKEKVDFFTQKLEHVDHLSWLGLYKDISSGTSLQPFWNKHDNDGKKPPEHCQRVLEKFIKMSQVKISDEVRALLKKPTFDNWQWEEAEMLVLLRQMYIDLDLVSKFKIEIPKLHQWLYEVFLRYNSVPFHNFKHCFMVSQMMYGLIWLIDLRKYLEDVDILILLTSAICHDLDHPGYNNAYQINARTELALRYNDISPLENHHCSVAFEILGKPETNIFSNLSHEQFKHIREGMIKCILATDMAKHNEIVTKFKSHLPKFDYDNKEQKFLTMMVLMKVSDISNEARPLEVAEPWIDCLLQEFFNQLLECLVKAADISNEVRPPEVSEPWADCLLEEFFTQSDMEKLEGLPVAPFMDRDKVSKSTSQIGFIKFVLLPLFESLGELFPVIENDIIQPVRNALVYYTDMQKALEEEKQRKEKEMQEKLEKEKRLSSARRKQNGMLSA